MAFTEEHQDHRDSFEIIAFHDKSVKTEEELELRLQPLVQGKWDGRELPFPVLLDSTGTTIKEIGLKGFPTMVLIDPEGNVESTLLGTGREEEWESLILSPRREGD